MLPGKHRLRKQKDFDRVYKRGKVIRAPLFLIRMGSAGTDLPRFAVVVSNKVSKKAVDRNRVRRRTHAAWRDLLPRVKKPVDVIISMSTRAVPATQEVIQAELVKGLTRLHLLKNE